MFQALFLGWTRHNVFFKSRDFYRISLFTISVYALFHAGSDIAFESVIVLIRISQWAVISIRILANLAIRSAKNRLTKATSSRFRQNRERLEPALIKQIKEF